MTETEVQRLATYNAERARGIMHTPEWDARMAEMQRRFNERTEAQVCTCGAWDDRTLAHAPDCDTYAFPPRGGNA